MPWKNADTRRAYDRAWSKKRRDKRKALNDAWRAKRLTWLREYKSSQKCSRCGEDHPATLHFHHLHGKDRDIAVGAQMWGEDRLLREIAKCVVLCANCHAKEHWSEK